MTFCDRHNPLEGLSPNQIVLLFEKGSGQTLNQNLRKVAINVIRQHQESVAYPTLQSSINSILKRSELEEFAAISAQSFFGKVVDEITADKRQTTIYPIQNYLV